MQVDRNGAEVKKTCKTCGGEIEPPLRKQVIVYDECRKCLIAEERRLSGYRRVVRALRLQSEARKGFTLIELMIVILIVSIISALALPTILPAIGHRQVSESARMIQGMIVGARDAAVKRNAPSGFRLIPDPQFTGIGPATYEVGSVATANPYHGIMDPSQPLACSRIVPIEPAPNYSEGFINAIHPNQVPASVAAIPYPGPGATTYGHTTALLITEEILDSTGLPNPRTNWFWNVRLGDKIQVNNAGPWYTIIGPMTLGPKQDNTEMFVNVGVPGSISPIPVASAGTTLYADLLFVVDGRDDNQNGWIDEGWDGIDSDGKNGIDDVGEWEKESWQGASANVATGLKYTIARRPTPVTASRDVILPSGVVIDLTGWNGTQERSRLPVNPYTGYVDILVYPNGQVVPTTIYSSPSSIGMAGAWFHFWIAERGDVGFFNDPASAVNYWSLGQGTAPATPLLSVGVFSPLVTPSPANPYTGPIIKGEYYLLSLAAKTGQLTSADSPGFDDPASPINGSYNVSVPFQATQQGRR